jgi:hypothetical protein
MNLKIVVAVLVLALVAVSILYFVHPLSTGTAVTNSQQAAQAATNASVAINQIGSTIDSITNKLG